MLFASLQGTRLFAGVWKYLLLVFSSLLGYVGVFAGVKRYARMFASLWVRAWFTCVKKYACMFANLEVRTLFVSIGYV